MPLRSITSVYKLVFTEKKTYCEIWHKKRVIVRTGWVRKVKHPNAVYYIVITYYTYICINPIFHGLWVRWHQRRMRVTTTIIRVRTMSARFGRQLLLLIIIVIILTSKRKFVLALSTAASMKISVPRTYSII